MIWITPQSRLDETLARSGARHVVVLVSDAKRFQRPNGIAPSALLLLELNDISEPRPGLILPEPSHVEALLGFDRALPDGVALAICCYAGISRSTAAAYILACAREPATSEQELAAGLRAKSPSATPNIRLVTLADEILDRDGRMRAAILGIGRGRDAFEGTPFCMGPSPNPKADQPTP